MGRGPGAAAWGPPQPRAVPPSAPATEVTLAVSACISMYAAAEWPEAFGLSPRSPCVWVVVSLWNAAWGLVAYRAFGVGSRAAATPDGALVGANESSAS